MGKELDGKTIVDREAQQELFSEILECKETARLLVINDREGTGKSTLLRRLKYKCEWVADPQVPVGLVALDDEAMNNSFAMISRFRDDLVSFQLGFPRFDKLNVARTTYDTTPFAPAPGAVTGAVNASGAYITGGNQAGVIQQIQSVGTMVLSPKPTAWANPDFERIARDECVKAFFDDLKEICQNATVVLLFDSWDAERGSAALKNWIQLNLLRPHCFDVAKRPARLIVVIAGREDLDLASSLGPRYQQLVRSYPFKAWDEEHIKAFVKLHGYEKTLDDNDWAWLCAKLKDGKITLGKALQHLEHFKLTADAG